MAFSAFVTTVTQDKFIPKVVDNVLAGNVLLERFLGNSRDWGSGHKLVQPIKYTTSSAGGSYSGFDTFDTSQSTERVNAEFDPKQNYFSVVISGIQQAVNKGDAAVLDLLATEMDSKAADMSDGLGTQLYDDGTGNNSKDIVGLDAAVDDGNGTATYAGLARGTYTTWVSNLDSSSNAITLAELRASFDEAKIGNDAPTLVVMHPSEWTTYEGLLTATINYHTQVRGYPKVNRFTTPGRTGQTGDIGFDALYFRGIPVVADEKQDDGTIHLLNEKHIWFATLAHPKYGKAKYGFAWTGLKEPTNQDASVGQFLLYGNIICDSCRSHAYLTGKS